MRFRAFVLVLFVICLPALLLGDTLYLTDGSKLKGKLVRYENDTLYFETAFGAAVKIHKQKALQLVFGDGSIGVPSPDAVDTGFNDTAPGSLQVVFEKVSVTSRVIVQRGKEREAIERANSIEQALFVGNGRVFSYTDSTTDKIVGKGPETTLRNDFNAVDFTVALKPDFYHVTLVIGNTLAGDFKDSFDPKPVEHRLLIENLRVESGKTTIVRVGTKKKRMGLAKGELYVIK